MCGCVDEWMCGWQQGLVAHPWSTTPATCVVPAPNHNASPSATWPGLVPSPPPLHLSTLYPWRLPPAPPFAPLLLLMRTSPRPLLPSVCRPWHSPHCSLVPRRSVSLASPPTEASDALSRWQQWSSSGRPRRSPHVPSRRPATGCLLTGQCWRCRCEYKCGKDSGAGGGGGRPLVFGQLGDAGTAGVKRSVGRAVVQGGGRQTIGLRPTG